MRRLFGFYATAFVAFGAVLGALLVMAPAARAATYSQIVDNSNSNRFQASGRWIGSSWSSQKYGRNYRVLKRPLSVSDSARFKIRTPAKDSYRVLARWPSDSGYNNRTRFWVKASSGWKLKTVNQRWNGGKWVSLGTYTLNAGDSYRIQVASRSAGKGYIIADAVKVVRVTSGGTTTSSGPTGLKVVREAKTWLGVPYRYGGASRNGVDCSGLTMMVYKKFGKYLPHNAAEQFKYGTRVYTPAPGNLVFGRYDGSGPGIQHVGIVTGSNQMIHAPQPGTVVRYATFKNSYYNIAGVRRYVPNR